MEISLKINEENFIRELKMRNEKALEYLVDNYTWILKTVIKRHLFYLPNFYEECMNDCLLAIWDNIDSYKPERGSFKNWIGAIAKYRSLDYVRKYLRDLENQDIEDVDVSVDENALADILRLELRKETKAMLDSLNEEDREIFKQLYFEDKKMDEISKNTGLSKSVLYNRLSRARKKMRKKFIGERGAKNEGF